MLNPFEITELCEKIGENEIIKLVTYLNRAGKLRSVLNLAGLDDMLQSNDCSDVDINPRGKIVLLGDTRIRKQEIEGILKQLNISKDRLECCFDYNLANYDVENLRYNYRYSAILVGPMSHSIPGKGLYDSLISMLESETGYPRVVRLIAGKELKMTKTNIRKSVERLLKKGFLSEG